MDFVEGLPKSSGYEEIVLVDDRFSKYSHFITLTAKYSAQSVAVLIFENVYKLHEFPLSIVSDKDKIFTSLFQQELLGKLGTNLHFSSAYHFQTDGQTERLNRCIETYLRCICFQQLTKWKSWLAIAEQWYNSNFHTAIKMIPFQALYGFPPSQLALALVQTPIVAVESWVEERQNCIEMLKHNLEVA